MDVYKVRLTEPAENDLRDIVRYISSQLNEPTSALDMMRTIQNAISKLETTALAHPLVRDDRLAAMGYRLLVVKTTSLSMLSTRKRNPLSLTVSCIGVVIGKAFYNPSNFGPTWLEVFYRSA